MSTSHAGGPGGLRVWQEARNADGRVYYYNVHTKATQWNKPVELMTPVERAFSNQPWKEYTAEGGRKYWYNTETKQSSWQMPEVYKNILAQQEAATKQAATPSQTFVAGGTASFYPQQHDRSEGPDRQAGFDRGTPIAADQQDPNYNSFEEAEAAFIKLLKRSNVQQDWTWDQVMRATIRDAQYRALKDPKDRKAAFEKYALDVRMQEKDRAKERLTKLRADFGTMLRSHPEIKYYSRWTTVRSIIEGETIFRSTNDENERRQLFEEYIVELKKSNVEKEAVTRKAAMDDLVAILKALDLEPYTRWSEAQTILQQNERFSTEEKFKTLSRSDVLTAFENHIKSLERTFNDARQQQKSMKAKRERQNRDRFIDLLKDLKAKGKIKAGTKWIDIFPILEKDERYVAMLGQSGSTPLDLFWDMVEDEERALRGRRNEVLDVLDDKRYEITTKTTFEEFSSVVKNDRRTASIDQDALQLIFARLKEKVMKRTEDEKHSAERHQRRMVDALRSRIKHLEPAVTLTDSWETIRPRVEKTDEYKTLESDELRRSAFDKVLRRLKEKEEDVERERERRHRDRDRDRDRDRHDDRNGYYPHRSRHTGRLSRTPEPDAYEADRRKAQADRERNYRKASTTGLSPAPRDRDRYRERDRSERDRGGRYSSLSHYDRERREREEERERLYRTRGDPRSGRDELDYGDGRSGGSSARRRRGSDADSVNSRRDVKRTRIDARARDSKSPPPVPAPAPAKEEPAVHSGSEEGEIEED